MAGAMSSLHGKGSGKSSSLAKGKGKGKKGNQLGIAGEKEDDDEESDGNENESKVPEALKKVRKCRDQAMSALSNLEEALKKTARQVSTKGKGGALATQLKLEQQLKQAKALLLKQREKLPSILLAAYSIRTSSAMCFEETCIGPASQPTGVK